MFVFGMVWYGWYGWYGLVWYVPEGPQGVSDFFEGVLLNPLDVVTTQVCRGTNKIIKLYTK